MKKILIKFILIVGGVLVCLVIFVMLAFHFSPKPGAMIIRHLFSSEVKITDESGFEKVKSKVALTKNHNYNSKFGSNTYDLYLPKGVNHPVDVLIWVHGGGFVGGDKSGVKEFATKLAFDAQMAVTAMNYKRAPESQYPNQLIQVGELIKTLKSQSDSRLNLSKLMFGGDSAGAQIALQYALTQTNLSYGKAISIPHLLTKGEIKATLSYCGPVDLQQVAHTKSENKAMQYFVKTVAWSELGTKKWESDPKLQEASLVQHLTNTFPPTYITDGNAYSFQDQGIAFSNQLKTLGVPVSQLFFKTSKQTITHEYQFDYAKKSAQRCYDETLAFVRKYQ